MEERTELEEAIARLEAQRDSLGDAAVDAALVGLRQRLAELDTADSQDQSESDRPGQRGERRVVTILFCDVVGSTALAETMDPEAWTEIMNAAFERLVKPIDSYDGMVNRLLGDAVLAFFGAPTAHEDDPRRAVLAALEMLENIRPFREELKSEQGLDFDVRIGINTGLAVVGEVGSAVHGEYSAMGDAVNVAARMEQTAAPGTVQIGQDTYALIAPLFEVQELGGIPVKGKSDPVPAYRVLGRKAEPGRLRGLTGHGISSPLVGRDEEFATAQTALTSLLDGEGGILAILGEAGIGKSRLLSELRTSAKSRESRDRVASDQQLATSDQPPATISHSQLTIHNSQLLWLEGHTLSYGRTISYWPFQEILRAYARIDEDDNEAEAWRKLEGRVRELFPAETAEILPYLASLLAIEVTDEYAERVKYLDGEALGRQVYRAARRFFQRLAEKLPLVLVFDDLHWMDASSAGLVEHLLPLVERVPILLIGLSRPDPETPAARLRDVAETGYGERFTVVSLPPLSADDSGRLVQNLLTIDDLPDHVRRMMIDRADGNPYYLEEIVRDLIEAGVIVQEASTGRWRATRSIEKVTVPETIQGLLLARIDRLDDELKRVVRRAAVVGRSFLYRVLSKVLDDDRDLDEHLARLQNVELILEKQRLPELEYIFKHALAQEAAYDSILIQERRRMHGRVGTAIETLMAERLEEFYGLLAYHYSAAEDWERAQEYLFKAGDQAGRMAADAEALAHYQQAIEAYARVHGDDWEPLERAQLERKIGEALFRLGEHNQARAYLVRALSLLGEAPPATHWGTRLGLLRATLRQAAHRLLPRLFVRPMIGAPDDRQKEVLQAGEALGWLEALVDTERFLLNNLTMLNLCERGGFARQGAHFASTVGITADAVGRLGYAETYYDLSAEYSQHISPYRPTPLLETGLAAHYYRLGHFEKSVEISLHCAEIAQSMGDLRQWGAGIIWSAWSNFALGRFEQARRTCEHMIDVAEEGSDRQVLCWGLGALGACLRRVGLVDQAIASLVRAIVLSEQLPDYTSRVTMSGYLGRCYLNSGDLKKALSELETGASIMSVHGDLYGASTSLGIGLAEAHLTAAESAAGNVQREWMGKANLATRGLLKSAEYTRMAMPEAMMFKGRFEWLRGKLGAAEEWWRRALKEANETGARCGEGVIHLEIGRRLGDRDHLLRAESILEEVGARLDLELAREARAEIDNG